jgi:asparagine synthase (glutamine-hydrolysing)
VRESGRVKVDRWWSERLASVSENTLLAGPLGADIAEAVSAQLMSDVPLGILLSGGIDSSAVTALASHHCSDLTAFSCGFEESSHDERPHARLTADTYGVPLHETVMTWEGLCESLPDFIDWFGEPFFDYSAVAVYRLCRMAREQGIKVLLAGDGADEVFAGYLWYDDFNVHGRGKSAEQGLEKFFAYKGYFTRDMLTELAGRSVEFDHLDALRRHDRPDLSPVSRGQWLDFHTFLPDDILAKVDRAGMAAGVEIRVPLIDQRILDKWFLLSQEIVFRNGVRKSLFKEAMIDVLPPTILTGRKKGFGFPLGAWRGPILRMARYLLPQGRLVAHGYASPAGIRDVLDRRGIDFVWLLLMAELWMRRCLEAQDLRELMLSDKMA